MSERNATETAVVAGGCFWCVQPIFDRLQGIRHVECGYAGGHVPDPSYRQICTGKTGHAEAIRIEFDPSVLSYGDVLDVFFATHDPTQLNRQGNDIGTQYRSAVFPLSRAQEAEAKAAIARAQVAWNEPVVTTVEDMPVWYPAEPEHQQYFDRVGDANPYCTVVINPKLRKFQQKYRAQLKPSAQVAD